jgi:hypothetical protein
MTGTAGTLPTTSRVLRIDVRFVGALPGHANGGVVAGHLAERLVAAGSAAVTVRLRRPVPLDTDLDLDLDGQDGRLLLGSDGELLASAVPAAEPPTARPAIDLAAARDVRPVVDVSTHPAPGCFVCGPRHPDGLDLQPGAVAGSDLVATVWRPSADLADAAGRIDPAVVWAALDCPSWYGAAAGRPALLGTMTARRAADLAVDRPVVVTGWPIAREGRKTHGGAALHTPAGRLVAVAATTWIHPPTPPTREDHP